MTSRSRLLFLSSLSLLAAGTAALLVHARTHDLADEPIASFRGELLDIAFRAASALPVDPHIKNRSRAQEAVVMTALELGQPQRALVETEQIDNWRRGACYAELAFYCARHGDADEVQHFLDLAGSIAEADKSGKSEEDQGPQSWQRDRIRAAIARTHLLLGQTTEAAPFEENLTESELGPVQTMKASFVDKEACDAQLHALDAVAAKGDFDQLRNALQASARLFDRFYGDADRRARIEEKIEASWEKAPLLVRIELLTELTNTALDHHDPAKALALVDETKAIVESAHWATEDYVPLLARLAELRHRAGDAEHAREQADAALAIYEAGRDRIVNIYRARALRPLAEAYDAMGDTPAALGIYKRAVEEGVENPNSRPRAEDLSATCCSMAARGVEPDDGLRTRILEICAGLSAPW
jgi:tetratricopeptide (TPR) repeat protein